MQVFARITEGQGILPNKPNYDELHFCQLVLFSAILAMKLHQAQTIFQVNGYFVN